MAYFIPSDDHDYRNYDDSPPHYSRDDIDDEERYDEDEEEARYEESRYDPSKQWWGPPRKEDTDVDSD